MIFSVTQLPTDVLAPRALPFYDVVSALRLATTGRQMREMLPLLADARISMRRRPLQMQIAQSVACCFRSLGGLRRVLVDMSFAACDETVVQGVAKAVGTLPLLRELNLAVRGCSLSNRGVQKLARALSVLRRLTVLMLDVGFNDVDDEGLVELSHMVMSLTSLETLRLDVSRAYVGDRGAVCLAHALRRLPHLEDLSLGLFDNGIGDTGACELSQAVRGLRAPARLCLGLNRNQIDEIGVRNLAFALEGLDLCELKLLFSVGHVAALGAEDIASSIASLRRLEVLELDLNVNQIGPAGTKLLADCLLSQSQTLLRFKLLLAANFIQEAGLDDLAQAFAELHSLSSLELDLSGNAIADVGVANLACSLASLPDLSSLSIDLRGNAVGEIGACELAKVFGNLDRRQRLQHFALRLAGGSTGRIPGTFGEGGHAHRALTHLVKQLQAVGCACDCSW